MCVFALLEVHPVDRGRQPGSCSTFTWVRSGIEDGTGCMTMPILTRPCDP